MKWISYIYTFIPSLLASVPPTPHYRSLSWASCALWVPSSYLFYTRQCKCQSYSPNVSHPLLPQLCPRVCSLCLHLYSCPGSWFSCTIFLDSTYMHWYMIFVFLLLNSVCQALGPSISLQMTQFCFFLCLSNIPWYMYTIFILQFIPYFPIYKPFTK